MNATAKILPSPFQVAALRKKPRLIRSDCGSVAIPVYRKTTHFDAGRGKRYGGHIIIWRDAAGRHLEKRADLAAAEARAREIANTIAQRRAVVSLRSDRDDQEIEYALQQANQCELTLRDLINLGVAAFHEKARTNIVRKTCPEIFTELLVAKRAEEAGSRWIDDLDSRLGRFIKAFPGPLADLRAEDFRTWLARLNLSKRSANNYRTAILALVAFAKERRYLAREWDELAAVKPHKIKKGREELYSAGEIRRLLYTAEKHYPQHVPTLAIMAFAGCRHSELRDDSAALDWQDVHLEAAQIHIDEHTAKSNTGRRYVPMQPNLVAWLKPYHKLRGSVCPVTNLTNALARIAAKAEIEWKANGLRNSFISYRCAITHDVARVAGEAGNSVGEIHKSYRREISEAEAKKWWDVMPTREDDLPLFNRSLG